MATQATALPQAQGLSVDALQQLFSICDEIVEQKKNGAQLLLVPVPSILPLGSQAEEVLKGRLEFLTNLSFDIANDEATGRVLYAFVEPMPPANSADSTVGMTADGQHSAVSSDTKAAASKHTKKSEEKTPRPKNAFMIYRLDLHANIAGENPGMHNNDISKVIGARWRAEKPHIKETYKKRAEEEKRQHAISHPGYRYQPRKPSEKKKRMTKNKLAKIAASGSINTDATTLPDQSDANDQSFDVEADSRDTLQGEGFTVDTLMMPYQYEDISLLKVDVGNGEGGDEDFAAQLELFNSQVPHLQASSGMIGPANTVVAVGPANNAVDMMAWSNMNDFFAANTSAPLVAEFAADHTITREDARTPDALAEQRRQEKLDEDFFNTFLHAMPDEFSPTEAVVPVLGNGV